MGQQELIMNLKYLFIPKVPQGDYLKEQHLQQVVIFKLELHLLQMVIISIWKVAMVLIKQ
ncbi:MAG: hypothetical protein EBT06_14170 [Gammaproteobacteria bacterium]|nr:hypothetical protein [Gammaproteobacteria bacterium]